MTSEGLRAVVKWNNLLKSSKFIWEKINYSKGYVWVHKSED